jgi:WD40 repeat protein
MKQEICLLIIALLIMSCDSPPIGKQGASHVLQKVFHQQMPPEKVDFSADGKYLLTSDGYSIYLWRTKDFALLNKFTIFNHNEADQKSDNSLGYLFGVRFSPDSKSFFVGFKNGKALQIELDSGKRTVLEFEKKNTEPEILYLSHTGKILILVNRYMDITQRKRTARDYVKSDHLIYSAITSDDKYIISYSGFRWPCLDITETATGKTKYWRPPFSLYSFIRDLRSASVEGFMILPDDDTIVVDVRNGNTRLYSLRREKEIGAFYGNIVDLSPDCKTLVMSSAKGNVSLWDIASRKRKKTLRLKLNRYLSWLRGTDWIASFSSQGELVIQSTETGELICKEKLNVPADVVLHDFIFIGYLPSERLLLLGNFRKGYIDAYKIK